MATSTKPAYRADQVGSLLRPPELLQARADVMGGKVDRETLKQMEDDAILAVLERQRTAGVDICVDGEFRRAGFLTGFVEAVDGFVLYPADMVLPWKGGTGDEGQSPNMLLVSSTLVAKGRIADEEARFLREHAPGPFKITLPSPIDFGTVSWRAGTSDAAYPTAEEFVADAAAILASEVRQLSEEGVPYIQIDAPAYTFWADESVIDSLRSSGLDPDTLLDAAITADNVALDAAGPDVVTGVHLCRGNSMGRWLAEGGYDPLAERLFAELRCDRLLLEYDDPRAGSLEPLRFVPDDKTVVLGLVTTKSGTLEAHDELLRRIDEASTYVPLDRLALSPQCGFASSGRGNPLTEEEQWRKLELVAAVADEVWG